MSNISKDLKEDAKGKGGKKERKREKEKKKVEVLLSSWNYRNIMLRPNCKVRNRLLKKGITECIYLCELALIEKNE